MPTSQPNAECIECPFAGCFAELPDAHALVYHMIDCEQQNQGRWRIPGTKEGENYLPCKKPCHFFPENETTIKKTWKQIKRHCSGNKAVLLGSPSNKHKRSLAPISMHLSQPTFSSEFPVSGGDNQEEFQAWLEDAQQNRSPVPIEAELPSPIPPIKLLNDTPLTELNGATPAIQELPTVERCVEISASPHNFQYVGICSGSSSSVSTKPNSQETWIFSEGQQHHQDNITSHQETFFSPSRENSKDSGYFSIPLQNSPEPSLHAPMTTHQPPHRSSLQSDNLDRPRCPVPDCHYQASPTSISKYRSAYLRKHIRTVHGNEYFWCHICNHSVYKGRRDNLREHIKKSHQDRDIDVEMWFVDNWQAFGKNRDVVNQRVGRKRCPRVLKRGLGIPNNNNLGSH